MGKEGGPGGRFLNLLDWNKSFREKRKMITRTEK